MPSHPLPDPSRPVTLPESMSVEDVRVWLHRNGNGAATCCHTARAVLALVEAKVREAYDAAMLDVDAQCDCDSSGLGSAWVTQDEGKDATVARVMGRTP